MITILVFLILLSIVHLSYTNNNNLPKLKSTSLLWLINLWLNVVILLFTFNYESPLQNTFSLITNNSHTLNINSILIGCDYLSLIMIALSIFLILTCVILTWNNNSLINEYLITHHIILMVLVLVFLVNDVLAFYFLFESTLIPLFIMIGVWGYSEENVNAAYYFFFYTFIGSLFMLLAIFNLYSNHGSTNIINLSYINISYGDQTLMFIGLTIALAVKIPMFPVHIWLPQAHVEAPVNGSVLLAGILLKLGGYGFINFLLPLCNNISYYLSSIVITLSLIAIIITALTTCSQNDVNNLIAYSSVSHMGLVTIGIFTQSTQGVIAAIILMVAHGFVSSSLFIVAYFLYNSFNTSLINYFNGLITTLPLLSSLFLLISLGNIAFPGSINFIAEFLILLSLSYINVNLIIISCIGPLLASVYSLNLYNNLSFGSTSAFLLNPSDINNLEFYTLIIFIFFIYYFGIFPSTIINSLIFNINLILI